MQGIEGFLGNTVQVSGAYSLSKQALLGTANGEPQYLYNRHVRTLAVHAHHIPAIFGETLNPNPKP